MKIKDKHEIWLKISSDILFVITLCIKLIAGLKVTLHMTRIPYFRLTFNVITTECIPLHLICKELQIHSVSMVYFPLTRGMNCIHPHSTDTKFPQCFIFKILFLLSPDVSLTILCPIGKLPNIPTILNCRPWWSKG